MKTLTEEAATQVRASVRESKKLLGQAKRSRSRAKGISKQARARAIGRLEELVGLSERVVDQIRARFAGEKIPDRLVSLFDPDARPVRRGKLSRPNEFGYVVQLAEVTAHTRKGARGLLLPPKLEAGSTHENTLLTQTVAELTALGMTLKEASFDAGFTRVATDKVLPGLERIFIAGSRTNEGSARTRRRLARFRVGCEGRISPMKRGYHAGRCRLRGERGLGSGSRGRSSATTSTPWPACDHGLIRGERAGGAAAHVARLARDGQAPKTGKATGRARPLASSRLDPGLAALPSEDATRRRRRGTKSGGSA